MIGDFILIIPLPHQLRWSPPFASEGELPSMTFPFFMKEGVAPSGDGVIVPKTYDW